MRAPKAIGHFNLNLEPARKSGSSSVVERLLAKEKVVGSNPIFRSKEIVSPIYRGGNGDVAKRLRRGSAKPLFGGSNPPVAFFGLDVTMRNRGVGTAPILS